MSGTNGAGGTNSNSTGGTPGSSGSGTNVGGAGGSGPGAGSNAAGGEGVVTDHPTVVVVQAAYDIYAG